MYTNNLRVSTVHKTHIVTTKDIIAALTSQTHLLRPCALVSAAYVQYFLAPLNIQFEFWLTIKCVLKAATILATACIDLSC